MGNRKQGICMADGGITQESPEQLMARMAAKYGAPTGATQQPQPQSTQQAPQQPPPKSNPLGIMSMLKGRSAQIDKAVNGYADGGIAGHVKFEGKGGPRDDQIPVKVAGQEINVSNKEQALIIPAKTAANAQAMAAIKQIIADSNDGRQPDMGHGDSNFAEGGIAKPYEKKDFSGEFLGGVKNWMASKTPVSSEEDAAKLRGADDPFIVSPVGPVGKLVGAQTVKAGIQQYADDAAKLATSSAGDAQNIAAISRPLIAADAKQLGGVSREMASAATEKAAQDARFAAEATQAAAPVAAQKAGIGIGRNVSTQGYGAANRIGHTPSITGNQPANYGNEGRSVPTEITKDNPGAIASDKAAPNVQDAANANESSLGGRQGAYMAENNLRSFEDKGNGIARTVGANGQRSFTNVGTENVTDATKQIQTNSYDGAANNASMAKANAIRQEMIDRQPQGGVHIMSDGGIEAANAEKTARWRQDDLIEKAARGNQAAVGAAINANASTANAATNANAEAGRVGVAMRGQDMTAQNEAARLAGNPVENQLKQAQAQGIMAQNDSAKMLADLERKALSGDAQAMASYQAITGKKATPATDRYMTVTGGEEVGPDGMTKVKKPSGVFDAQTGKFVPMDGGQQKATTKEEVAAALATGKISKDEITKRLTGAGLNPKDYGL